jgi:hypothetical protein
MNRISAWNVGGQSVIFTILIKVNRDRYNIDAPECKKKAYMDLDFRTLNGSEI